MFSCEIYTHKLWNWHKESIRLTCWTCCTIVEQYRILSYGNRVDSSIAAKTSTLCQLCLWGNLFKTASVRYRFIMASSYNNAQYIVSGHKKGSYDERCTHLNYSWNKYIIWMSVWWCRLAIRLIHAPTIMKICLTNNIRMCLKEHCA